MIGLLPAELLRQQRTDGVIVLRTRVLRVIFLIEHGKGDRLRFVEIKGRLRAVRSVYAIERGIDLRSQRRAIIDCLYVSVVNIACSIVSRKLNDRSDLIAVQKTRARISACLPDQPGDVIFMRVHGDNVFQNSVRAILRDVIEHDLRGCGRRFRAGVDQNFGIARLDQRAVPRVGNTEFEKMYGKIGG